jgi:hypothetical protein
MSIQKAREAKEKFLEIATRMRFRKSIVSLGLTRCSAKKWCIKVNLKKSLPENIEIPTEIGDVNIVVEVVGKIRPQHK